jgi:Protein of unknown function (DUF1566)
MKRLLSYAICIVALGTGSISSTALAQTTAPGPYYATPSWDQQLPASTRFIVLSNWNNEVVLDRETGLVWERQPLDLRLVWVQALFECRARKTGNRLGWRLPSVEELSSLLDASTTSLPAGHPFQGIGGGYWTATTWEAGSFSAYFFNITPGFSGNMSTSNKELSNLLVWCVRGGSSVANPL